nr:restriction endonuclease subunit S [uncultured Rhodoferax sp.]
MPKVSDLFTLEYGHSLELNRLFQSIEASAVNFVGRAARNNGVTARVQPIPGLPPAPAGTVSVALGGQGGAGVAFLQPNPYYCGRDVMILTPKLRMNEREKLWWATCISANRFRFGFGRQANRTLKDIRLPEPREIPRWVGDVDFGKVFALTLNQLKKLSTQPPVSAPLAIASMRVPISEIFEVSYGTSLELNRLLKDPSGINYVARTAKNNGVAAKVSQPKGVVAIAGECLSVAVSGSVLETFVQMDPFITGFHIMVLRPKKPMCIEELMFYAACIRENQQRYSYGRQANRTLKDLLIPSREAIPAWVYGALTRVSDTLTQQPEV